MDVFKQLEVCPEVLESARRCHISSATSPITVEFMKQYGAKNCIHMFEGVDPFLHTIKEPDCKYLATVSFMGTKNDERDRIKAHLEKKIGSENVKFYGYGYGDEWVTDSWAKICSSSKYVLSMNTYNEFPTYFSGRLFELLSSGACTFHYDPTESIGQWFKHGEHLFYFKNQDELIDLVRNTSEEQEIKVRAGGRKEILEKHTWDIRVQEMMVVANEDSSVLG